MSSLKVLIEQFLTTQWGGNSSFVGWITFLALIVLLGVISGIIAFVFKYYLGVLLRTLVSRISSQVDEMQLLSSVPKAAARLVPGILFASQLSECYTAAVPNWLRTMLEHGVDMYNVIVMSLLIAQIVSGINEVMKASNRYGEYHLEGIFQALKLVIYLVMAIIVVAILIGQKPSAILTGIGASAAILMLVFKDTIMGFVASIQLTSNKMIKRDDWIAIDRLGINGTVEEVNLTTVKVRNWDNSVSTIPPYSLVSDSFQNWTEMQQKKARQMKRVVFIDLTTVKRDEETGEVNLTKFRKHVMTLIANHPQALPEEAVYVRLLSTTGQGLPVEISFFLSETNAVPFEQIVSAFMEEVFASLADFGLRAFQKAAEKPV